MGFKKLEKLEIAGRTARFALPMLEGSPSLTLRPATSANRPYFTARLREGRALQRHIAASGIDEGAYTQLRKQDRELYPEHVLVGWDGVRDDSGSVVPFTKEVAAEFLASLPDWIFDEMRTFASSTENFLADEGAMLGNSLGG